MEEEEEISRKERRGGRDFCVLGRRVLVVIMVVVLGWLNGLEQVMRDRDIGDDDGRNG